MEAKYLEERLARASAKERVEGEAMSAVRMPKEEL